MIPVIFPSYPRDEEIDKSILQHMTDKMEFDRQDVIDAVRQNRYVGAVLEPMMHVYGSRVGAGS